MNKSLTNLLQDCTVRIEVGGYLGTGFFVAPGLVLTCAHVVRPEGKTYPIKVFYKRKPYVPEKIQAKYLFVNDYPDLALLNIAISKHPCVYLGGGYQTWDRLYSYGYTLAQPNGEPTTVNCVGPYNQDFELIKLKEGDVQEGASGSPLLNERTGHVCGMIQLSRDTGSEKGGFAFPIELIGLYYPKLMNINKGFHHTDKRWTNAVDSLPLKAVSGNAIFCTKIDHLNYLPDNLVGRDSNLKDISTHLMRKYRLVLSGMGGIGKTAIAAKLAEKYLKKGKYVIWLEAGDSSFESMMDAIANSCNMRDLLAKQSGDNRFVVLRDILEGAKAKLLILDDMWNPAEVEKLLLGIPKKMPVLITSQWGVSIGGKYELSELDKNSAVELLGISSGGKDFSKDINARDLCAQFGYHPYALELAGKHIQENMTPKDLREKLSIGVVDLSPLSVEKFRRRLIEESYSELDDFTKKSLRAFGAYSSHGATSQLLAAYLNKPLGIIETSLYRLSSRSLIKNRSGTPSYFLHSLIYSYIVSLLGKKHNNRVAVASVVNHLREHSQEFDLLALDLPTILAALGNADPNELIKGMSYLVIGGFPSPGPDSYFVNKGQDPALLERLDRAIAYCRKNKSKYKLTRHYLIGKRSDAHFNNGKYEEAISGYEEALALAPNKKRAAIVSSVAARTYAISGQAQQAQLLFKKSYRLAKTLRDDLLLVSIMGQESHAAGVTGDFKRIKEIAKKQIAIAQKMVDENSSPFAYKQLFFALLNLGSSEMDLAKQKKGSFESALSILDKAKEVALNQNSDFLLAYAFHALGEDYHHLHREDEAQQNFEHSLQLWRELGMIKIAQELEVLMISLGYRVPD